MTGHLAIWTGSKAFSIHQQGQCAPQFISRASLHSENKMIIIIMIIINHSLCFQFYPVPSKLNEEICLNYFVPSYGHIRTSGRRRANSTATAAT